MTLKVVDFKKQEPAHGPDVVLEEAKGNYEQVLIIGYTKDGFLDGRASNNLSVPQAHMLCSQMQKFFLDYTMPEYSED